MRNRRITTGVILAILLFLAVSILDAWPLRLGLMLCFIVAIIELCMAAEKGPKEVRKPQGKRYVYLEVLVLIVAALSLVCFPIRPSEMIAMAVAAYVTDIAGYFAGTKFGKTRLKFLQKISPSKTAEGYAGGLAASLVVTGIYMLVFGGAIPMLPKIGLWLLGGIVGAAGDLLGSAAKRELKVKDSDHYVRDLPVLKHVERLMTGHGGYLDRFDSLSLVIVFYYFLLLISRAFA